MKMIINSQDKENTYLNYEKNGFTKQFYIYKKHENIFIYKILILLLIIINCFFIC